MGEERTCLRCGEKFEARKEYKTRIQKYCSLKCKEDNWSVVVRPKMKNNPGLINELNHTWKGDKVGYAGIHKWMERHYGKPQQCEKCGDNSKRKYEWASIGHKYLRDRTNWIRVCTPCHREIDNKIWLDQQKKQKK